MSQHIHDDTDSDADGQPDAVERITDPEDYSLRRRLRQLHDARERVRDINNRATRAEITTRDFTTDQRDRLVAEAVADYILELTSLMQGSDDHDADEFLDQNITTDDGDHQLTLNDIVARRGAASIPYLVSMQAWDRCNQKFDQMAGPEFDSGMPTQTGFDSTGGHP
jgi:hypothetical protein